MRFYIPECLVPLIFPTISSSTYMNYFNDFLNILLDVYKFFSIPEDTSSHQIEICGHKVSLVIDCAEQLIVKSLTEALEKKGFCGKYNDNTITLLLGSSVKTGEIWVKSKSYWGSKNDQAVANSITFKEMIPADEKILADKGFKGEIYLTKFHKQHGFSLSTYQEDYNKIIDKYRIIIENVIGYIKNKYMICSAKLRFKTTSGEMEKRESERLLNLHSAIWHVACGLFNDFGKVRDNVELIKEVIIYLILIFLPLIVGSSKKRC